MFEITALTPVGARVTGLRVDELDEPTADAMRHLLADRGVVVLPDQDVDDDGFLRFLRSFGQTVFTVGETPVPGFPDLNVVTNIGRVAPPRSTFHTDTSYVRDPPIYTALRAVEIPERGGDTLFTNQYAAYEHLPRRVRKHLEGRTITHVVTGLDLDEQEEISAIHPIFGVHPVSGRTYLYLSTPQRCAHVSDMSPRLAAATVRRPSKGCGGIAGQGYVTAPAGAANWPASRRRAWRYSQRIWALQVWRSVCWCWRFVCTAR